MSDSVVIRSATSSKTLTLSEPESLKLPSGTEYFRATLTDDNLSASAKIYAYQPHGHITTLFDRLAVNWRGWSGEEQWASLEGELTLKCTRKKTGKVKLEITLLSGHYEDDWSVQAQVFIEPNQLDEIALEMRQFFLEDDFSN